MRTNPLHSPGRSFIKEAAASALQTRSIRVDRLSGHLFRSYRLTTSAGFFYILRSRPGHHVRLLRHEEGRLDIEAGALRAVGSRPDIVSVRLIDFHTNIIAIGSPYLISGPFAGSILSEVEPTLSRTSLASIDRSLGQYVCRLASIQGIAFGPLQQNSSCHGSASWAKSFVKLLEVTLQDAEDLLISLPYADVRALVRRHSTSLDMVTQPRLVLVEFYAGRNIVVDLNQNCVTGVLDFSTAFWGDPYLSDCFRKPTASFIDGFGRLPTGNADERIRQHVYVVSDLLYIQCSSLSL